MSSASSHSESRLVKILACRSRVLSHPSRDSVLMAIVPSSSALGDSGTANALAAMQSISIFPTEWNSRTVSSSVLALSADETELVKILRGILSVSRGVKDMNEAWLAEAGLSPAPGEVSLRKRLRKVVVEQPPNASGSTARTSTDKGNGTVELEEVPERGSSPFWTEGPSSGEYLWGALQPTLAKQVYECSSEELINRASKLAVWILALRATNKELKATVGQELAAATEQRVKELEAEIEKMQAELESHKSQRRELE
ncbi:hypothetical protein B296_00001288 [Ensete ventricosum]|uniref:Uncharacterized protein n=1 Tax=Ensete ventricosum TaxID=4639 RepID=A0A427B098_ENSVE|nr:hypothetical protein B296_00001288 [Ensete ventricosum]